jgi:hypothetical protein
MRPPKPLSYPLLPVPSVRRLAERKHIDSMSIAAGFLHGGGVLLCADTEHSTSDMKIHAPKIGYFECPLGKVGYAYAGNAALALACIQKCQRRLQSVAPDEAFSELERTLDKEYRRNVFSHPNLVYEPTLHYQFLIAIQSALQPLTLYVTDKTTIPHIIGATSV